MPALLLPHKFSVRLKDYGFPPQTQPIIGRRRLRRGEREKKGEERDFPGGPVVKIRHFHGRGHGFDPPRFPALSPKGCRDAPDVPPPQSGPLGSWDPEEPMSHPDAHSMRACLPRGCGGSVLQVKFQEGSSPLDSSPWLAPEAPPSSAPQGLWHVVSSTHQGTADRFRFSSWRSVQKLHSDSESKTEDAGEEGSVWGF